ncbi:MAG TPA: ATP-dependent helicase [Geobacterales bacterium]|nr:ATP-dependent helicase [Geobacterales bacterium]
MFRYPLGKYSKEDNLSSLNPYVRKWFENKFDDLTPPQYYSFKLLSEDKSILITAPTGSGKTLSAFLVIISKLFDKALKNELKDEVYCIYVSPLKALNNDIKKNLSEPLSEIKAMIEKDGIQIPEIRVAVRSGDVPPTEKQKQLKKPPHILVTTPESLAIILNSPKFAEKIKNVKYVIIDEIHELANNKRGVHLALSLERLRELVGRDFIRIGLGATLHPLEEAAKFLMGIDDEGNFRECWIVDVSWEKQYDLLVMSPVEDLIYTPDDKIENRMYEILHEMIEKYPTLLIFTNTRSGTERVVFNLKKKFKYTDEDIAAHHGSLSRIIRLDVEERLKQGLLKAVVSSTSLELGIDIGYIKAVVQLGSPKSITRAIQRIGRSGHKFQDVSIGRIIVMNRDDLVECAVMLHYAKKRLLDRFYMPRNCLDVLAQHIVGMAINKKWNVDEALRVIRRAYPYKDLEKETFIKLLKYLAGHYVELNARKVYGKIWFDEADGMFGKRGRYVRTIYFLNLGTIPDEVSVDVFLLPEKKWIGNIEEEFLMRLKRGDVFVLGGRTYRFSHSKGMRCYVERTENEAPTIPPWFSEQLPLNFDLAMRIGDLRLKIFERLKKNEDFGDLIDELPVDEHSKKAMKAYFLEQYLYVRRIPNSKLLLIEKTTDLEGRHHIIFHALYGRRTNDALARIFAIALSKKFEVDIGTMVHDNGFSLIVPQKVFIAFKESLVRELFNEIFEANLENFLRENLETTELMKRKFRHNSTRSFLVLRNYKGYKISVNKQQLNSQILLEACKKIDPNFPVIEETFREILEDIMDLPRAKEILEMIKKGHIKYELITTKIPSPFSHTLITFGEADVILMKDRRKKLKELHSAILKKLKMNQEDLEKLLLAKIS